LPDLPIGDFEKVTALGALHRLRSRLVGRQKCELPDHRARREIDAALSEAATAGYDNKHAVSRLALIEQNLTRLHPPL
jgi:hypothetical protein